MRFRPVTEPERVAAFLEPTPILGAYPLSYLDPVYASFCKWFGAWEGDEHGPLSAILLVYEGLSVPAVITLGDGDMSAALLRWAIPELPVWFYAQMPEEHVQGLLQRFRANRLRRLVRMGVERDAFRRPEARSDSRVVPIGHADTADLMDLYQHYPDAFFEPYQLEAGGYFGIRDGDRLVSVAGVHSVSARYDVAVIGNVVTHPDYRNRGLSTLCTGYLLQALFERVRLVALNVEEANPAARRSYQKLGFTDRAVYVEGHVELR